MAQSRLPWMVFDYIDGAAGNGFGESNNSRVLQELRLKTSVLVNVQQRSLRVDVMGHPAERPFGITPMGMCNLVSPEADRLLARMAAKYQTPLGVSTVGSTPLERMIEMAEGHAWFQLYFSGDGSLVKKLVRRADAAGYKTLVVTLDVPEVGKRPRELRRGFKMPFRVGLPQFIDFALHPRWSLATLAKGKPRLANFGGEHGEFDRTESRAGADWRVMEEIRQTWPGNLVVKGVLGPEDALKLRDAGVDAIQISSHGGRQFESVIPPILGLRAVRKAVGPDFPLLYDSGIRSGEDVLKAYALGANFVFIGRPVLYAIAAGGEKGLAQLWDAISDEASIGLAQMGLTRITDLGIHHILNKNADEIRIG